MGGYYQGKGKGGGGGGKGSGGKAPAEGGGGGGAGGGGWSTVGDGRLPGDTLPGGLVRKLGALGYPELDSACLSGQAYFKIILWLEEEKIRLYDKIDRAGLRAFNKAWYAKVSDYCKDLNVDGEGLSERDVPKKLHVLNALTNLAVHDIYRDKVEANELSMVPPAKPISNEERQRLRGLVPVINRLLDCFRLPKLEETAADSDTLAALHCVHVRICVPSQDAEGDPINLEKLPLGMPISDPEVKRAAAVLRLLHGLELQQLQVNINHVINELQQLTADPKTDARLGRVGR